MSSAATDSRTYAFGFTPGEARNAVRFPDHALSSVKSGATWQMLRAGFAPAAAIVLALVAGLIGASRYEPFLHALRTPLLAGVLVFSALIAAAMGRALRSHGDKPPPPWLTRLRMAALIAAITSFGVTTAVEANFQSIRARVLAAPAAELGEIGRHVIVGIDDFRELDRLVEKGAAAGVFFTRRNVKGRNALFLKTKIEALQKLQAARGGAPLWITADQEGGVVQRLSPPLPRQPPLSSLVRTHKDPALLETAVRAYAARQGKALASLGINVNFAPVVDVNFGIGDRRSGFSRISSRAISKDPAVVTKIANWYCDALSQEGVRCTKKHFPGLGRLTSDTHVREATIGLDVEKLASFDWLPFAAANGQSQDWIMLGHVRVTALDPDRPASASPAVVEKLRKGLGHTGVIVTDDFSMGAIRKNKLGAGQAAVSSLNAGVDLVLVSFDPDQIYVVLDALLTARREGKLDETKLSESLVRLRHASERLLQAGVH